MATPYIDAAPDAFAQTVLLPGEPARAAYIAEHFFDQPKRVCSLRNMWGYTGSYQGHAVSVMGSGMGIPSSLIYATELIDHFGVQRLLRVGTCGAMAAELELGDLVLASGACTDSGVNRQRFGGYDFAAIASFAMVEPLVATARVKGLSMRVGNVFSTDLFYPSDTVALSRMQAMGVLGVEMEAAGLYGLAAQKRIEAASLLTVSDHLLDGRSMSAAARESGLETMILGVDRDRDNLASSTSSHDRGGGRRPLGTRGQGKCSVLDVAADEYQATRCAHSSAYPAAGMRRVSMSCCLEGGGCQCRPGRFHPVVPRPLR